MGITASADYGGSNMGALALSIIVEELSTSCASTGGIVSIHNCLYVNLLDRMGTDCLKSKYLANFSTGQKIGGFALSESGNIIWLFYIDIFSIILIR